MLTSEDPITNAGSPVSVVWIGLYFDGTALLESIVRKHGMLDWQALNSSINNSFLAEIFDIYRQHGIDVALDRPF